MNIGRYWEAKLQLRPLNKELTDYTCNQFIKNKVEVVEMVNLKEGLDFYLTSRKAAVAVARKLKKVFKGDLVISTKLFGKNRISSKKVNRVTVLFRKS